MVNKQSKNLIIGINIVDFSSSGNIMLNSLRYAHQNENFDYFIIVPKSHYNNPENTYSYAKKKMNIVERVIFNRLLKERKRYPPGFSGYVYTTRIIKKIRELEKKYENILIHFHTMHDETMNIYRIFKFVGKDKHINHIFVTIHDSWYYTGGCCSFYHKRCFKWMNDNEKCLNCTKITNNAILSKGANYYLIKKQKSFKYIKNKATIIAVSNWIKQNLTCSILNDFDSHVIYGETPITKTNSDLNTFKNLLGLSNKKILLIVTYYWHELKGPKYIYKISEKIPDNYVILIIGEKLETYKYKNIINIGFIDNPELLSKYYGIADVYVSTSQEESLGLTTCEAQICGTPVVAFGHAGIKETISPKSGIIVGEDNNVEKMVKAIKHIVEDKPFKEADIINNGLRFAKNEHAKKMLEKYNKYKI